MKSETNNRGLELNEIAMSYQKTGDDRYFELLWNEVEAFAFMKGKKYWNTISQDDMKELALVCLYDCCRCLKEGTNILTYYGSILVNRYHDFYNRDKKRGNSKLNAEALSLNYEYEDGGCLIEPAIEDEYFNKEDLYEACKLVNTEIQLVELLDFGYKKQEIIEKLKIEENEYKRIIKSVRNKIKSNWIMETI